MACNKPQVSKPSPTVYCVIVLFVCLFRHFLQEIPSVLGKYPAGIKSRIQADGALCNFTLLESNSLNWSIKRKYHVESSDLPLSYVTLPSKKPKKDI